MKTNEICLLLFSSLFFVSSIFVTDKGLRCDSIYCLCAILWFIWYAFHQQKLHKIQFCIGGVILIGLIEKIGYSAQNNTVNRHGVILSCLKSTIIRSLFMMIAFGYGIVEPPLGLSKRKLFITGILYFVRVTREALLRLYMKNDERNYKLLILHLRKKYC
ncbi:unnamed protein product [Rotaria sp. Silwood1]|nr:unnamed protein product [Rotaria sp. Silwood1]